MGVAWPSEQEGLSPKMRKVRQGLGPMSRLKGGGPHSSRPNSHSHPSGLGLNRGQPQFLLPNRPGGSPSLVHSLSECQPLLPSLLHLCPGSPLSQ